MLQRMSLFILVALGALLPTPTASQAADPTAPFFRPGDRVLFLGDSITEQYQYSSYIELYLTTRYPNGGMSFYNAGIGGDTATGGQRRFADHVLSEKPTALTIDFGMNDGGYRNFDANRQAAYLKNTDAMIEAAKNAGVRVALISPNAVEIRAKPDLKTYLETQQQFYAPLKEIAAKHKISFVDQYAVTRQVLDKIAADGAKVSPFPDGVHTNAAGGLLMAHTILTGLGAPALVSDVVIDMAAGTTQTSGCTIKRSTIAPAALAIERTDTVLPLPVLKEWRDLLPYVNQLKDLNYYGLTVKGLKPGKYILALEGTDVAEYSAEELATGVNLGLLDKGPIYEQGQKVLQAINDKNKVVHQRFRGVRMAQVPDWLADVAKERRPLELAKRAEQIAVRQAEIYHLAEPVPHRFEIKAAK